VVIKSGCKIQSGTMITENVIVKEGATILPGSVCSLLTYDSKEKVFKDVETNQYNLDYFEKGVLVYIPYDMSLKESELLGGVLP